MNTFMIISRSELIRNDYFNAYLAFYTIAQIRTALFNNASLMSDLLLLVEAAQTSKLFIKSVCSSGV